MKPQVYSVGRTTVRDHYWGGPLYSFSPRDIDFKHINLGDFAGLHPLLCASALLWQSLLCGGAPRSFAFPNDCINADLFLVDLLAYPGHGRMCCLQSQHNSGIANGIYRVRSILDNA